MAGSTWRAFVLLLVLMGGSTASADSRPSLRAPMRAQTVQILRSALLAATADQPEVQKQNLLALDRLARTAWPHLTKLRRIRVILKNPESCRCDMTGWLLAEDDESITWFTANFGRETAEKIHIRNVVTTEFPAEV